MYVTGGPQGPTPSRRIRWGKTQDVSTEERSTTHVTNQSCLLWSQTLIFFIVLTPMARGGTEQRTGLAAHTNTMGIWRLGSGCWKSFTHSVSLSLSCTELVLCFFIPFYTRHNRSMVVFCVSVVQSLSRLSFSVFTNFHTLRVWLKPYTCLSERGRMGIWPHL